MSDFTNPYESTETDFDTQKSSISQTFFTGPAIAHLKAASPWMKFMGIITYVSAALLVLMGIIIAFAFPFINEELNFSNTIFASFASSAAFGFIYIVSGIIYIFPAKYLYTFASKIKVFIETKNEQAMEIALRNNKSFWKFYGIYVIISIAIVPVISIISIVIAVGSYL